jgi:hypothetical protein
MPNRLQYAPHNWTVPAYGQRIQYAPLPDAPPPETSQAITCAQGIVGTLLYNARAVSPFPLDQSIITTVKVHISHYGCHLTYT